MVKKGTTLVIGASENPERYAYKAITSLRSKDYPVCALGRKKGRVAGVTIATTPKEWGHIDTVSLYIGPQHQASFRAYLTTLKPRRVIFNPGTENDDFERALQQQGISTERACTLVLLSTNQY